MTDIKGNAFILGIVEIYVMSEKKGSNLLECKSILGMILLWFRV